MVKISSIIFISISLFLSIILPLILAIILHKKLRFVWKAVFVGGLIFLVFQILTRIPLLSYVQKTFWCQAFYTSYPLIYGFLLALSAGLFEEIGRYIGFRFFLKKHLDWENGIAYGIGHGGLEAIFIGTTFLNDLIISVLINTGKVPPQIPQSIISTFVNATPLMFLIGGIERLFAFVAQIGLSIIVLYAVKNKKSIFLLLAILIHTILDLGAAIFGKNILLVETYVAIFAVLSFVWILKSKTLFIQDESLNKTLI